MKSITTKKIDMTSGSISKSLILYAIPIVLSDFLQQLYNAVDSIIVGNIEGKLALAAVGETYFIISIFLGLFLGVSLGTTVAVSRYYGARDYKRMSIAVDTTLKLTAILAVIFTAVGVLLVPFFLRLVNTADDVYADAYSYLVVYFGGISTQLFYNMLSGILKSIGDSRRPLYVLAVTCSLNIVLDYIMVGPMHMGVAGAALATVISQLVSCIILWIIIKRTPEFEKPVIRRCKMDKKVLLEIARVGVPYSLQRSIVSFSNMIVISYLNFFGATVMAGWSIYQKIDNFVISSILSLGSATTTFVSQNVGASKPGRIKKGVSYAVIITLAVAAFYTAIFCVFRYPVIKMFNRDEDVVAFASTLFMALMLVHPINTFPQIYAGAMRSLGKNIWPTATMITCFVVIRQVYLYLRWPYFQDPMIVVAAYHLTWTLGSIANFVLYKLAYKDYIKKTVACKN